MKMNKLLSVLISAALTASTFTFPAMAEENTEKSYDEIFTPASVENTEDMTVEMFDVEQWLTEGDVTEENPYMISSAEVLSQLADEISTGLDTLKADTAKALATEDTLANAKAYQTVVLSDMETLRKSVDAAEVLIPDALLPYPTYDKLLFSV